MTVALARWRAKDGSYECVVYDADTYGEPNEMILIRVFYADRRDFIPRLMPVNKFLRDHERVAV